MGNGRAHAPVESQLIDGDSQPNRWNAQGQSQEPCLLGYEHARPGWGDGEVEGCEPFHVCTSGTRYEERCGGAHRRP
jgi:hypothetical protein